MWVVMEESCADKHLLFEGQVIPLSQPGSFPTPSEDRPWSCRRTVCGVDSSTEAGEGHGFRGLS